MPESTNQPKRDSSLNDAEKTILDVEPKEEEQKGQLFSPNTTFELDMSKSHCDENKKEITPKDRRSPALQAVDDLRQKYNKKLMQSLENKMWMRR